MSILINLYNVTSCERDAHRMSFNCHLFDGERTIEVHVIVTDDAVHANVTDVRGAAAAAINRRLIVSETLILAARKLR